MTHQVNELRPELLGVAATNSFMDKDSSARLQMFCTHIGQALVVKEPTVKRTLTGIEREYGRYTHSIKMPCDAIIHKCVPKYPRTLGFDSVAENPVVTVIYENANHPNREIGVMDLTTFHSTHQYFGFKYQYNQANLNRLTPGSHIPKGTIIADSPSVTSDGDYRYGVEAQMALMSIPGAIEDGIVASESFLKKMTTNAFGSRLESWGKNRFPINLYGDDTHYKPFPDIGDRIRDDGLLFATRSYDELLSVVTMTPKALREVDHFDRTTYAPPNAKVIDVIVHKGKNNKATLPVGMDTQTRFYYNKSLAYYESLLNEYHNLRRRHRENLHISPEFHRLLVEAMAMVNDDPRHRVIHMHNRNPIDEWMVEIVFETEITPCIGFKLAAQHGDKGVICDVWKDEDMPVDASGNRADLIMDDLSTIKRMNTGRLYEMYINASGRIVSRTVGQMIASGTDEAINQAWDYLVGFYKLISPRMYEALIASGGETRKQQHLKDVAQNGVYLYIPTDNPVELWKTTAELIKRYPACYGPVVYTDKAGQTFRTVNPVLIGGLYMLMLEKIGNTWAGVSSARLQYLGIPAKLNNGDKFTTPHRPQPVKVLGESEVRLEVCVSGGDTVADMLDQTNNPAAHKVIVNEILYADKPTNIDRVIDRDGTPGMEHKFVPRGKGRVLTYHNHVMECGGMRFVRNRNNA